MKIKGTNVVVQAISGPLTVSPVQEVLNTPLDMVHAGL